ncbi:hypothetical protein ABH911_003241 [Pseudomonas protegens]|uniref:tail fiber assembly protein n=1 Tax=Pseudomonas protegens TaxID=380021 RepID=UPI0035171130
MSYAVRNDKQGWRAVSGPNDVLQGEWYSITLPPDPVPLPPTTDVLAADARKERDQRLTNAASRMGPLQDAVDEKIATDEEVSLLKLWKQYRIVLNRIDKQAGFPKMIDWPVAPDEVEPA